MYIKGIYISLFRDSIACFSAVVISEMLIGTGDFIKGDLNSSNLKECLLKD